MMVAGLAGSVRYHHRHRPWLCLTPDVGPSDSRSTYSVLASIFSKYPSKQPSECPEARIVAFQGIASLAAWRRSPIVQSNVRPMMARVILDDNGT